MVKGSLYRLLPAAVMFLFTSYASALTVDYGERQLELDLNDIVAGSNYSHRMYGPFRRQEVWFEGYRFKEFLEDVTGESVDTVTVHAIDGYRSQITDIQSSSWVLVTKENGHTLSIREHGPLRLIETNLGGRSAQNISLFDDWVWMIDRIVVDR